MATFLGKTITTAQATRIRNAHTGSVITTPEGGTPTLGQVQAHYLGIVHKEVHLFEHAASAAALADPAATGLE